MAQADPEDVARIIRSIGFYRTKAKNCIACAQMIMSGFGGEIPRDIDQIQKLPGVAVSYTHLDMYKRQPYGSGVYRVGIDIPEGTYQLVVGDGADDYSSCTVMADLDFDEDSSYLYRNYFIKGDKPDTITLEAGTFVELYNMQMKPTGLA